VGTAGEMPKRAIVACREARRTMPWEPFISVHWRGNATAGRAKDRPQFTLTASNGPRIGTGRSAGNLARRRGQARFPHRAPRYFPIGSDCLSGGGKRQLIVVRPDELFAVHVPDILEEQFTGAAP